MVVRGPDYTGTGLVNLVCELEHRLGSAPPNARLVAHLADLIPQAETYVVMLFDGLGAGQLQHPAADGLFEDSVGILDAPFPTTTTVSLASLATGRTPSQHGLLGYQLWLPEVEHVVNTIKWTTLWGEQLDIGTDSFLPTANTWERLRDVGREPITIQPGHFAGSQLSRALYRGCRYEPVFTIEEVVMATADLAAGRGRLIFTYVPQVDFAAHVHGQASAEYAEAVRIATTIWENTARRLPAGTVMIGTADHGHADFSPTQQVRLPKALEDNHVFYGDSRVMFVRGEESPAFAPLPATWIPFTEMVDWWGPGPRHEAFEDRAPDGVLLADDDAILLHSHSDKRLVGHHGGLTEAERHVPFLVAGG